MSITTIIPTLRPNHSEIPNSSARTPCPGDAGYDAVAMERRYAAKCRRDPDGCCVDLERIDWRIEVERREGDLL